MFAAIGRFSVRFRFAVIGFWVLAAAGAVAFLPTLSSVSQSQNAAFLPGSAPSVRAADLGTPFEAKNAPGAILVAVRGHGTLTAADEDAMLRAERAVAKVPNVLSPVRDQGQSTDGHVARALVSLNVSFNGGTEATSTVDAIRKAYASVQASAPPGLAFHLTGSLPEAVDEQAATSHTQNLTELLSLVFILALLLLVFRAALAPFATLLPAAVALVIAEPVIAESTKVGVQVSSLLDLLLIVIMLGAGTDYGLFLIFRVREEIRGGLGMKDAVSHSVTWVGESITFSGLTVIAAMMSLLLATFGLYKGLGPGLAIGVAVVLLANLTLLPALLSVIGRGVFWPAIPRPGQVRRGTWGRIAGKVVSRPGTTLAVGLVFFGGLALAMLDYSPAGFGSEAAPAGSDSAQGLAAIDAHFSSAAANPTDVLFRFGTSVWGEPQTLVDATSDLEAQRVFTNVTGPLDLTARSETRAQLETTAHQEAALHAVLSPLGPPSDLPVVPQPAVLRKLGTYSAAFGKLTPTEVYETYRIIGLYVSPDGRTLQFSGGLRAGAADSTAAMQAVPAARRAVSAIARELHASDNGVAGEAPAIYDISAESAGDLTHIIPVVLVILALLLALVLRSLVAPWYLVVSVGLSYLASLGLTTLLFVVIGHQPGINFVLPFFMFLFVMALGEDYNILVMTRIREETHRAPIGQAVRTAVEATGTTVTSAGIILAGTFGVLTVTGTTQVREIGLGLAAGVLLDTFFVRTLLVPSVVVLLGRWNWWPSKLTDLHADGPVADADPLPASV